MVKFINKILEASHKNRHEYTILFFAFCYLYIVSSGGFIGDDVFNSNIRGIVINDGISITDLVFTRSKGWFYGGRVFPFACLGYYIFYLTENVFIYKLYLNSMTILSIFLISVLYKKITDDNVAKRWVMLIAVIMLPIYMPYHSAIESYNGLFQGTMILGLLSFIFIIKYLKTDKYFYNILSCIFLMISLLTYEVSFLYIPILYLIVYLSVKNIKATLRKTAIHSVIFLLVLAVNIYARVTAPRIAYDGVEFSLNIVSIIKTFLYQFTATFQPLTYIKFHGINFNNIISNINFFDIVLLLFFLTIFISLLKEKQEEKSIQQVLPIIIVGIVLLFGVAFLYSLSTKMQRELSFGIAYSSIFFQYLGITLLMVSILPLWLKYIPIYLRNILIVIFGFYCCSIIIVNQQALRLKVLHLANTNLHSRDDIINSSQSGMLKDISNNSVVILDYHFDIPDIFANTIKKPVASTPRRLVKSDVEKISLITPDKPTYIVKTYSNKEFGGVVFGKVANYIYNPLTNTISDIIVNDLKLYIRKSSDSFLSTVFFSKITHDSGNNYISLNLPFSKLNNLGDSFSNSKISYSVFNIPEKDINFDSINFTSNIFIPSQRYDEREVKLRLKKKVFTNNNVKLGYRVVGNAIVDDNNTVISFIGGKALEKQELGDIFSLQIIVNPKNNQVSYASIIGNHPDGYKGFAIQLEGNEVNRYSFGYGDNKLWHPKILFSLYTGTINYLAITVGDEFISAYVNGILVSQIKKESNMAKSMLPIAVGNWIGNDRLFNGDIYEFSITNSEISEKDVKVNWDKVRQEYLVKK